MPSILDEPPAAVRLDLDRLDALLAAVPRKQEIERNVLIATWNICKFGNLTERWTEGASDPVKRNLHHLRCIGEIISRFDVVAVQEVLGNLKCLRHMMKLLGPDWDFLLTDVSAGHFGNGERMAFVYDRRRLRPSGLACELVVPEYKDYKRGDKPFNDAARVEAANMFQQQFARTPYAVSFRAQDSTFILTTMHVHYGDDAQERAPELKAIAQWMARWASDMHAFDQNLIVLGDFNIDRQGDELYQAFTSTGLTTAPGHENLPRTVFSVPGKPDTDKHYDQIAWFAKKQGKIPQLSMAYRGAGMVDFRQAVTPGNTGRHYASRVSDHFPLWAEFGL